MRFLIPTALAVPLLLLLAACEDEGSMGARFTDIGDADAGRRHIAAAGCGSCHIIPGIDGANGLVGPPLDHMGKRVFIAGLLRNTPENMTAWILDPQKVVPGNAMPDTGLSKDQARDVTAYLYTLR